MRPSFSKRHLSQPSSPTNHPTRHPILQSLPGVHVIHVRPSYPGAFLKRPSTFLLTSLVASLTKSLSALYCPGWMFCAAVLLAKPESWAQWSGIPCASSLRTVLFSPIVS